eukprot:25356_4
MWEMCAAIGRKEQTLSDKGSGLGFVCWSGTAFSEDDNMRPSPTAVNSKQAMRSRDTLLLILVYHIRYTHGATPEAPESYMTIQYPYKDSCF